MFQFGFTRVKTLDKHPHLVSLISYGNVLLTTDNRDPFLKCSDFD